MRVLDRRVVRPRVGLDICHDRCLIACSTRWRCSASIRPLSSVGTMFVGVPRPSMRSARRLAMVLVVHFGLSEVGAALRAVGWLGLVAISAMHLIASAAMGRVFLHEQISARRWAGTLLIVGGTILVGLTREKTVGART